MKHIFSTILLLIISISLFSCKKNNCKDSSGNKFDETRFGIYSVTDSTIDWTQSVWYDSYEIEIKLDCKQGGVVIYNYANLTNKLTDEPLEVSCEIIGDSIFISSQMIEGDDTEGESFNDYNIYNQKGYFRNDSIFLDILYSSNGGDPSCAYLWGKKN